MDYNFKNYLKIFKKINLIDEKIQSQLRMSFKLLQLIFDTILKTRIHFDSIIC